MLTHFCDNLLSAFVLGHSVKVFYEYIGLFNHNVEFTGYVHILKMTTNPLLLQQFCFISKSPFISDKASLRPSE